MVYIGSVEVLEVMCNGFRICGLFGWKKVGAANASIERRKKII